MLQRLLMEVKTAAATEDSVAAAAAVAAHLLLKQNPKEAAVEILNVIPKP